MSATKRSATSSELRDWKVWLIAAGTAVAVVHGLLQRLGWRAALLLLPLAGLAVVAAWMWLRRRPTGFAAEATRALAAHLPDGRPPRVMSARQDGHVWEVEWRLTDRVAGSALIKKTRDLDDRTVLMVEHNLSVVANLSHTITVLTRGRVLAEGDYATVSANPEVREAYMGTGHE